MTQQSCALTAKQVTPTAYLLLIHSSLFFWAHSGRVAPGTSSCLSPGATHVCPMKVLADPRSTPAHQRWTEASRQVRGGEGATPLRGGKGRCQGSSRPRPAGLAVGRWQPRLTCPPVENHRKVVRCPWPWTTRTLSTVFSTDAASTPKRRPRPRALLGTHLNAGRPRERRGQRPSPWGAEAQREPLRGPWTGP